LKAAVSNIIGNEDALKRSRQLIQFLSSLNGHHPEFGDVDFSDINATSREGENALHAAVSMDAYEIAEELIRLGIHLDARGDLGNTPLHEAASAGKMPFVRLLVEKGADLFALNEGCPPFTLARLSGYHDICDYLAGKMDEQIKRKDSVFIECKIKALEREIERLKKRL
jgi:ankyrin repeat protein